MYKEHWIHSLPYFKFVELTLNIDGTTQCDAIFIYCMHLQKGGPQILSSVRFSALQPCSPASLPEQGRTAHTLYII